MRSADAFAALERALDELPQPPRRALDLGTGTGLAAFAVARRFPEAEVVGVDLAERMVEQARAATPAELAGRVSFQAGDAERLPFADGSFELVTLANMIPFFDELARVAAPGGHAVFSFSSGPQTPIWVPPERLRSELERRGFAEFADFEAGAGTALLARKADPL
jgi:ubiquinone/menaquinone biosynthesis C-methylase UbiE